MILNKFIRENGIQESITLLEIKKNWYRLFAKPLSLHMSPSNLSEGNLVINVDSNMWLQELNFYKDEVIKKLQSYGIKNVRFRLGKIFKEIIKSNLTPHKIKSNSLAPEELSFIENALSVISDSELRDRIRNAMMKSFILQQIQKSES